MLVKAAPGLVLRDPETRTRIPDEGLQVDDNSPLWNRMLADGDVVKVEAAASPPAAATPQAAPAAPAKDDAR